MHGLPFDIRSISRKSVIALYAYIFAEVCLAGASLANIGMFRAAQENGETSLLLDDEIFAQDIVALLYLIVFITCVLICGRWIQRASSNAAVIRPDADRITPAWSVIWFFIPIANLWKPYQAMRQTWNSRSDTSSGLDGPMPKFAFWWWMCWVLTDLIANVSTQTVGAVDIDSLLVGEVFSLISAPFGIGAAFLFARLIQEITANQDASGAGLAQVFE